MNKLFSKKAFTLIELLIVVAIIAILAAIAVPNFLEAQTRAKVSRSKSDMRTLATAIEAYAVDNNKPPREYINSPAVDGPLTINGVTQNNASGVLPPILSTPIAYISNVYILDPFVPGTQAIDPDQQVYSYASTTYRRNNGLSFFGVVGGNSVERVDKIQELFGFWYMLGYGPDQRYDNNLNAPPGSTLNRATPSAEYIEYDSSNGTISAGNIIRSQKFGDGKEPERPITAP